MGNAVLGETGYERREHDAYFTEAWVTEALLSEWTFLGPLGYRVWEPACGRGDISEVLLKNGHAVYSSDLHDHGYGVTGKDFLKADLPFWIKAIITNPPYTMSEKFIERALEFVEIRSHTGTCLEVAMLLRADFDSAKSRKRLFKDNWNFVGKVTLTKRPRWDWWERELPQAAPRFNYAWFIWSSHPQDDLPLLLYAP